MIGLNIRSIKVKTKVEVKETTWRRRQKKNGCGRGGSIIRSERKGRSGLQAVSRWDATSNVDFGNRSFYL